MTENPQGRPSPTAHASDDDLTPRQRLFALEYLKDHNGKQAAIRAGYAAKNAESQASRLLARPEVRSFFESRRAKVEAKVELSAEYVLRGLKTVADRCMQAAPVMVREAGETVQKTDAETGAGVWEFDSAGANRSLELIGKHLKLFTDKVEASGANGAPLVVVIRDLAAEKVGGDVE